MMNPGPFGKYQITRRHVAISHEWGEYFLQFSFTRQKKRAKKGVRNVDGNICHVLTLEQHYQIHHVSKFRVVSS